MDEIYRRDSAQTGTPTRRITDASKTGRNKDVGDLVRAGTAVARNNPWLFAGGAVLLGLALGRFVKARIKPPQPMLPEKTRQKIEVDNFISEGNPNADPLEGPT